VLPNTSHEASTIKGMRKRGLGGGERVGGTSDGGKERGERWSGIWRSEPADALPNALHDVYMTK
jgi:hypothetical protein